MSATPAEIEACLAFVGEERAELFERLASAPVLAGVSAGARERAVLRDSYYDTPEHDLARADMALRWRRRSRGSEEQQLFTWKGPAERVGASGVTRAELEGPATPAFLLALLEQARSSGVVLGRSAACNEDDPELWLAAAGLVRVQARETERTSAALLDAEGAELCELALDLVRYSSDQRTLVHRELELEARGATGFAQVEALAAQLVAAHPGDLRPWPWSKTALGAALESLAASGELEELLRGEELLPRGYDQVEARLSV